MSHVKFNKRYFILTIILFATEVLIALFVHDYFIRPYFGDVLVVMLIYCFIKSFLYTPSIPTAMAVLLFAFFIESMQYFEIVKALGLEHNKIAATVIGNSFAWMDILAYIAGVVLLLFIEAAVKKSNKKGIANLN